MARQDIPMEDALDIPLLDLLVDQLGLDPARAKELMRQGSVWQGNRRLRDGRRPPLTGPGAPVLSLWHTAYPIEEFVLDPALIHHEDEDLLVVWKPAGVNTSQSVYSDFDCLTWGVDRYLESRGHAYRINTVNRLDRDTQGLVLYGKSKAAEVALYKQFMDRTVHKQYLARCPAGHDRGPHLHIQDHFEYKGKVEAAETHLRRLPVTGMDPATGTSLETWLALPVTGRTHQIRKHFLRYLAPLVGDRAYGGPEAPLLNLACVGYRLRHPGHGGLMKFRRFPEW